MGGPDRHGSHEPGGEEPSETYVQGLIHGAERGYWHFRTQGMAGHGTRLIGTCHDTPVGALHLDALVHPLVTAPGIVEAEGHRPHPRHRLRVRRIVFCRRLEPPDFVVSTHIRHNPEPNQEFARPQHRHAGRAPGAGWRNGDG